MGVYTEANNCYGVPEGIYFSFPCTVKTPGKYEIVCDLPVFFDKYKMIYLV